MPPPFEPLSPLELLPVPPLGSPPLASPPLVPLRLAPLLVLSVPLVPLPVPLLPVPLLLEPLLLGRAILPVTVTVPAPALLPVPLPVPEIVGQVKAEDPLDPDLVWVWCPLTESAWPAWPNPPDAGACDDLGMRAAKAVTAGAGPEDGDWTGADAVGRTRIETVENKRKTIAPAETTMTGTVLPAGWERKTAPVWPTLVLIRSANSASPSCAAGSGGQYPIRADSRSLRSAAWRSRAVRPESR